MGTVRAASTTGIYCLASCTARPLLRHIVEFADPAAAEAAGYRACHRCRPYRRQPGDSLTTSELVCAAVQLIDSGELDTSNEAQLAARIGVSSRHLRRLCVEHLGATPHELARSRRAHLARRLLDDTDLAITEVAHAAGYRSLRTFNRELRIVFHEAPGRLRARRRRHDRLRTDGGLTLRIANLPEPMWHTILHNLRSRALPLVEATTTTTYARTFWHADHPAVIELHHLGNDVCATLHLPTLDGLAHLMHHARTFLDANHATGPHPTSDRPGAWSEFELDVATALTEHPTIRSDTTTRTLIETYGTPMHGLPHGLTHLFPTPATLATADLDILGIPPITQQRIRHLSRDAPDQLEPTHP